VEGKILGNAAGRHTATLESVDEGSGKPYTWPTPSYPASARSSHRNGMWRKWGRHVHPSPPRGDAHV